MSREFQLSVDARKLVEAYEAAPSKVEELVRLQLKIAVERIRKYASKHHRYVTRTGNLERNGISSIVNNNEGLLWIDSQKVPYAALLHEGRKQALTIVPRNKNVLRWANGNSFIFAKRVTIPAGHPKPDQFLYQAADHELPAIQESFASELQKFIKEL